MMSRDKKAVEDFVKGAAPEIEVNALQPNRNIWQTKAFRADGAHAKTLAIILAHRSPRDLLTGQRIDVEKSLAWTNSKEYHHFFPRDYLKTKGINGSRSNCLANIVMLTSVSNKKISNRAPSDYLQEVQPAAGSALNEWRDSNLISEPAFKAALADDYDGFLNARCDTIDAEIARFCSW